MILQLALSSPSTPTFRFGVVPPVEASNLVSYLVLQTSFVTAKEFKACKSLEAYNQFVSEWVKEVVV